MNHYWLGVLTIPVAAATLFLLFIGWVRTIDFLDSTFGLSFEVRLSRSMENVSDYTLRHDIWWERSWGPFFTGGWYHERSGSCLFNRWVALGSVNGPCLMVFRKHVLDAV